MSAESNESENIGGVAPIDREHLAKYTLGDKAVEEEVLKLFAAQALQQFDKLKAADTEKSWREAAHTIKGSARGVGAWKVAELAGALEKLDEAGISKGSEEQLSKLQNNINEVIEYIQANQG